MQPKLKNFFTKAVVSFHMRSEMVSMSTSSKLLVNLVCHTLLFMLVFSMSINPTTRDIRTNNFSHHLDKMFSSSGLNILDQLVTPFVNGLSNNVPKFSIQLIKCHVETGSIYFSSAILTLSYPHPAALTQNGPRHSTVLLSTTILTTLLQSSGKPTFYFIRLFCAFSCFFMLFHASVKAREKYNKSNPPYFSECLGIWLKK